MRASWNMLDRIEQTHSQILTVATAELRQEQQNNLHRNQYPRVDYVELQKLLNINILNYNSYKYTHLGGFYHRLETALRSDIYLAFLTMLQKRRHEVIFAMSERVGIPYAFFNRMQPNRKTFVTMFQSWSHRQEFVIKHFQLYREMDTILVHCHSMKQVFEQLGASADCVHIVPYGIDHHYFSPLVSIKPKQAFILSVGEVRSRNYDMLFRSVKGLPVEVLVLASGMWYAREKSKQVTTPIPDMVQVRSGVDSAGLRALYAQAQFVVLPVKNVVFSAGATASLEAMAMGRAVIAANSPGIRDFVIDGETGLLVEPDNAQQMHEAIEYLLANPQKARQMGENGRSFVEKRANLDIYVARIGEILQDALKTS